MGGETIECGPEAIERTVGSERFITALFGFVAGLSDEGFLEYVIAHIDHKQIRHIFFSEIKKRTTIPEELIDKAEECVLSKLEQGIDKSRNETVLRYLVPSMSMQMRGRTFQTIIRLGTNTKSLRA